MKNQVIAEFEQRKFNEYKPLPSFRPGDTVRVEYKIVEGKKARLQPFEGVVIRYKKGTVDASFTVRKIGANGVGVERVFPVYSPNINGVEIMAKGQVRRSRLFYLRDLSGKKARIKSKYVPQKTES